MRLNELAIIAAVFFATCPAWAQGFGGGDIDTGGFGGDLSDIESALDDDARAKIANAANAVSGQNLNSILSDVISSIDQGGDFCERLSAETRIDCLADTYEATASSLSGKGEDIEVKRAFKAAAAKLRKIVGQNADRRAPRVVPTLKSGKKKRTTSRPLTKVKTANVARANARAEAVLSELSTTLLRSKSQSRRYLRLARVVESQKVLLRS